ncbi:MAG TPA: isoprenylcysteine carboxylmethyltransferase family protein [Candidatus Limnocylindrales bacterium]|nr:isoprenylcysteine carboxylmethyltransferase family protein [Candidatus Limnocylindrales bacterium]
MTLKLTSGKMSGWGVGPRFAVISLVIGLIVILINARFFPTLILRYNPLTFLCGAFLILLGIGVCLDAAVQVHKAFDQGRLVTSGIYAHVRNPVYAAWILLVAPGLVLVTGFLLLIAVPFFMYALIRILIVKEDVYLEKRFGSEYLDYKKRVNSIIPT